MDFLISLVVMTGVTLAGAFVLDRLITWAIWFCAPFLPNDLAGPGGWFLDTLDQTGVFDRRRRF